MRKIFIKEKIILQSKRKNFLDLKSSCWEFDLEIEKKKEMQTVEFGYNDHGYN